MNISVGEHVLNMWLAGFTWNAVADSMAYRSCDKDTKVALGHLWVHLEFLFDHHCYTYGVAGENPCDITRRKIKGTRNE